ncbi:MgtC/SapB family protein [Tardiphaga sp.]|uniref:MgtC/SapB family protein n=1 Tax=Tardiphaga sp. TaxID=1926292 RepID=UPI0019B7B85E|nr:MgtC/SapB family protein [Tardiphaga sp.]MBC7580257.1 MgtC/SapB family protein [Tardiphaga sp.]
MMEWSEIILRLGVATLAGGAIGLNRDLHGKPVGLRTLALVSLATAMVVVLVDPVGPVGFSDAGSRVIQGILTGIGFLGAGVIFHAPDHFRIRGLTSAACTWLTACVGILCGAGQWRIVIVALLFTTAVISIGGPLERALHRLLGGRDLPGHSRDDDPAQSSDAGPHQPGK